MLFDYSIIEIKGVVQNYFCPYLPISDERKIHFDYRVNRIIVIFLFLILNGVAAYCRSIST